MGEVIRLRVASSEEAISLQSASGSLAVEAVSPRASFERVDGGTRLDITDIDGTKSAILPDGATGQDGVGIKRAWVNSDYELVIELTNNTVYISDSIRGRAGADGSDGADGADGVTFTPSVSSDGTLSWTNDGEKQNPLPVNIKGPQGEPGTAGQDGGDGADGVTFTPSVSSEGVLSWTNDGGRTNPQSVNIRGPQGPAGSDATVTVDDALSDVSENPVQNKVISAEVQDVRNALVSAGFVPVDNPTTWTVGNLDTSDGTAGTLNTRIRTTKVNQINSLDYYIKADSGVLFFPLFYDGNTYVPRTEYLYVSDCSIAAVAPSGATGFRLMAKTVPEANLTNAVETTAAKVHFYRGSKQDKLTFDTTPTSGSTNPVTSGGVYTALQAKADPVVVETVSGTDPVITGVDNHRYVCGTVDTLTLTPPSSGIVDVVFTSGTTPTVLSVPSTVKWPDWFNPSSLDASTTYEINVMDGILGAVMAWT